MKIGTQGMKWFPAFAGKMSGFRVAPGSRPGSRDDDLTFPELSNSARPWHYFLGQRMVISEEVANLNKYLKAV